MRTVKLLLVLGLLVTSMMLGAHVALADKPLPPPGPQGFDPTGPTPSAPYLGMTTEQRELAIKKEAAVASGSEVSIQSFDPYYKSLDVPYYQQEKSYWCGPASAKGILTYLGKSYTQTYLAGPWDPANSWPLGSC